MHIPDYMKFKVISIAVLMILLAVIYFQFKSNIGLSQDVTRWRDNYLTAQDTNAKIQKRVQDIQEQMIKQGELWRIDNETLKKQVNILHKENSRLQGLISLNIRITDTLYSTDTLKPDCTGTISFIDEWMTAKVTLSDSSSLEYQITAPLHIIRYVKNVPVNPHRFQLWAIEHTLTKWLIRKKQQDRLRVWSDNPHLITSVESYSVKQ